MMEVTLIVNSGSHKGQEIALKKEIFEIGKSPRCHLTLGGDGVGRHHCAIFRKEGYAALKPLDPAEVTTINGKKVEKPQKLRNGDILKIGAMEFEVQLTVGVSGQKLSKVQPVSEAAARAAEKKQIKKTKEAAAGGSADDDLDLFAIFGEEAPTDDDLPSFITKKHSLNDAVSAQAQEEEDAMAKEKKMQESTRNAAGDAIKAMLNQARR